MAGALGTNANFGAHVFTATWLAVAFSFAAFLTWLIEMFCCCIWWVTVDSGWCEETKKNIQTTALSKKVKSPKSLLNILALSVSRWLLVHFEVSLSVFNNSWRWNDHICQITGENPADFVMARYACYLETRLSARRVDLTRSSDRYWHGWFVSRRPSFHALPIL